MPARNDAFRDYLEAGDVAGLRVAWSRVAPHLPQPDSYEKAEIVMHVARTATDNITFEKRAYSHAWLTERMLPSQLPDHLKPSAQQICPVVVSGVGISVNYRSKILKPAGVEIEKAMGDAVEDCFANGDTEPALVTRRMKEARAKTERALFGR